MDSSTYHITLDIQDTRPQTILRAVQGDTTREIFCSLTDNGRPYNIGDGCIAVFKARKPDGTYVFNDCTIEDNTIKYQLTPNNTAVAGMIPCEIVLYDAEDVCITSPRFTLMLESNVYPDNIVESTDEFTALIEALALVSGYRKVNIKVQDTSSGESLITITDKDGNRNVVHVRNGATGPQGPQGPRGESGIYYGDTEPTDPSHPIWIDTSCPSILIDADEEEF